MFGYFKGIVRKFVADPPELLEDVVHDHMPYMGTVHAADNFDAKAAEARARELKDAYAGFGANNAQIIDILVHHSNEQRQAIKEAFVKIFRLDLESELRSELTYDFERIAIALLATPRVYDARELREAVKGVGTREWPLIEILCTRSNEELKAIKEAYAAEFGRDAVEDLKSDTGGYLQRLVVSQLNAGRDQSSVVDKDKAEADAQAIVDAGPGQWFTDEAEINNILCLRNYDQLKATFKAYQKLTDRDIKEAIKKECSGSLQDAFLAIEAYRMQDAFLAIVKCSRDTGRFFASSLHLAMAGDGTNERTLTRIIVSRSELDLAIIAELYEMDYGRKLSEAIESEVGGDFKKMLLAILGDLAQ